MRAALPKIDIPHSYWRTSAARSGPSTRRTFCSEFEDTTASSRPLRASSRSISPTPSNSGMRAAFSRMRSMKEREANGNFQAGMPTWRMMSRGP